MPPTTAAAFTARARAALRRVLSCGGGWSCLSARGGANKASTCATAATRSPPRPWLRPTACCVAFARPQGDHQLLELLELLPLALLLGPLPPWARPPPAAPPPAPPPAASRWGQQLCSRTLVRARCATAGATPTRPTECPAAACSLSCSLWDDQTAPWATATALTPAAVLCCGATRSALCGRRRRWKTWAAWSSTSARPKAAGSRCAARSATGAAPPWGAARRTAKRTTTSRARGPRGRCCWWTGACSAAASTPKRGSGWPPSSTGSSEASRWKGRRRRCLRWCSQLTQPKWCNPPKSGKAALGEVKQLREVPLRLSLPLLCPPLCSLLLRRRTHKDNPCSHCSPTRDLSSCQNPISLARPRLRPQRTSASCAASATTRPSSKPAASAAFSAEAGSPWGPSKAAAAAPPRKTTRLLAQEGVLGGPLPRARLRVLVALLLRWMMALATLASTVVTTWLTTSTWRTAPWRMTTTASKV
mmetsp:Transcript_22580/g.44696  ORF Transcript_22580/g.44696 Transcript_22580/m.44696 type:complete len:476 (-) Transcript_22580:1678-3105(-)